VVSPLSPLANHIAAMRLPFKRIYKPASFDPARMESPIRAIHTASSIFGIHADFSTPMKGGLFLRGKTLRRVLLEDTNPKNAITSQIQFQQSGLQKQLCILKAFLPLFLFDAEFRMQAVYRSAKLSR
jgi:hypothetical protein